MLNCVETLITVNVFPDGAYHMKFHSEGDKKDIFESLSSEFSQLLIENNINSKIYGREKTPFSIWRKIQKKKMLEEIAIASIKM